jgi:hypothetical protein
LDVCYYILFFNMLLYDESDLKFEEWKKMHNRFFVAEGLKKFRTLCYKYVINNSSYHPNFCL